MNLDELLPYELKELLDEILSILQINKFETKINSKIADKTIKLNCVPILKVITFVKMIRIMGIKDISAKNARILLGLLIILLFTPFLFLHIHLYNHNIFFTLLAYFAATIQIDNASNTIKNTILFLQI